MIPYLIYDDYAGLGSKVGFIFGGFMIVAFVFTYFCVPECKGKTLEEVDHLFRLNVPMRDFGKADASLLDIRGAAVGHNDKSPGDVSDIELADTRPVGKGGGSANTNNKE